MVLLGIKYNGFLRSWGSSFRNSFQLQKTCQNKRYIIYDSCKPAKKKDSEMKFQPNKNPDYYLDKRTKKGFFNRLARDQGNDTFSVTMGGFFVAGLLIASVAPTWIFPGRLTDYYEHQESIKEKKSESLITRRAEMLTYKYYISPEVEKLFSKVLEDLGIKQKRRESATLFSSDNFNIMWFGNLINKIRLLMGIPHYLEYSNIDEVKLAELRHKPMISYPEISLSVSDIVVTDDNKEDYRAFLETFVLSDNAKKFMIASKVTLANSTAVYLFNTLATPLLFSITFVSFVKFNIINQMFKKPFIVRLGCYSVGYSALLMVLKLMKIEQEGDLVEYADRKLYKLSRDYLDGGIEFYTKTINRGRLFRQLHPQGYLYFDEDGDAIPYWFETDMSEKRKSISRLQFALDCLKNQQLSEEKDSLKDIILSM